MSENNIKKLIIVIPILGVLFTSIFLTSISIVQLKDYFENQKQLLVSHENIKIKNEIKSRVLNTINLLDKSYEQIKDNEKQEIKNTVNIAYDIIEKTYENNKGLAKEEIIEKVKEKLAYIKFFENKMGYYFLFDYNGTSLMHPHNSKYEGKNFLILDDIAAQNTINKFLNFLKLNSEGFLTWKWFKPNESIVKEKIGYLKKFEPLDVFIGSAKYEEDIYFSTMNKLQELLNIMSFLKEGYVFAFDYTGHTISHTQKELLGKNRWHLNIGGKYIVQDIIKKGKESDGGFVEYIATVDPLTNKPSKKISYVKSFDKFDWVIGTGVYTNYIENEIIKVKEKLDNQVNKMIFNLICFSFIATLFGIIILYYLSKKINAILEKYKNSLKYLNENLEQKVKTRTHDLEESKELLKEMAEKDSLTNLYNRRYLNSVVDSLIQISIRNNEPLCLIMIDIDKFKKINDTYGHGIGDEILVQLSNKLLSKFRKSDVISRVGGEEFVVVFPKTKLEAAFKISEELRKDIENSIFKIAQLDIKFTISIGITILDKYEDKNLQTILKRADEALYDAKKAGRNKTLVYKTKEENEDSYST